MQSCDNASINFHLQLIHSVYKQVLNNLILKSNVIENYIWQGNRSSKREEDKEEWATGKKRHKLRSNNKESSSAQSSNTHDWFGIFL